MSSRRGRRARGRARSWDPAAARRANAGRTYVPYTEPEGSEDDPVKAKYWMDRFRGMWEKANPAPDETKTQQVHGQLFGQTPATNRSDLRRYGVGVRGVSRSQVARPVKRSESKEK